MNLAIISHTEHYIDNQGQIVGWGATIREINYLARLFDKIYHIAPLHPEDAPPSAIPYATNQDLGITNSSEDIDKTHQGSTIPERRGAGSYQINDRIEFVPLHVTGGVRLSDKLKIIQKAPANIAITRQILDKVDFFQFRAPTGIGVYMIPWLKVFSSRPGWFKYAGNWVHENPPIGSRFQRFLLKHLAKNPVTINGAWPGQKKHCLTFENPCLTQDEIDFGREELKNKDFNGKLNFAFVGRLEEAKGVGRILEAFGMLKDYSRIGTIHFVGDGPGRKEYYIKSRKLPVNVVFHGFLDRQKVGEVLNQCHVFLLPSQSEGFPKVIAEAANYGCIPLVSDVSSVGQYVHNSVNGFVFDHKDLSGYSLHKSLSELLECNNLKEFALRANQLPGKFSFNYYLERIKNEVLPLL